VLRLCKLGPGREAYYLQAVGIEPPGQWIGRGPEQVGLTRQVAPEDLTALLGGREPRTGEALGSARNRVRVSGFDLTFAAENVRSNPATRPAACRRVTSDLPSEGEMPSKTSRSCSGSTSPWSPRRSEPSPIQTPGVPPEPV
jgi:hypothetical protein